MNLLFLVIIIKIINAENISTFPKSEIEVNMEAFDCGHKNVSYLGAFDLKTIGIFA